MNVGVNVLWYDAANLRNGANQVAYNLGICKVGSASISAANCRGGIGGDWMDAFLNWRYHSKLELRRTTKEGEIRNGFPPFYFCLRCCHSG